VLPARSAERAAVAGHGASDPGGCAPPGSPAIHTIELSKRYRSTVALAGLSMTVARGEVFGFLGPNGAGKTTTLRMLTTLLRPTSGTAMVAGADLLRVKGILNLIGEDAPVAVHGVHHVFHPPVQLDAWPDADRRSRIVFITRDIAPADLHASFVEHVGAARI